MANIRKKVSQTRKTVTMNAFEHFLPLKILFCYKYLFLAEFLKKMFLSKQEIKNWIEKKSKQVFRKNETKEIFSEIYQPCFK